MHEEDEQAPALPGTVAAPPVAETASRRNLLRLGALGAAAIVTIRPGMAQAAVSGITCSIEIPDPARAGKWIKSSGSLVSPNATGAFPPPSAPLAAKDVQNAIKYGTSFPGYSADASTAYTNYIKSLTQGTSGFTCFASIQTPGG